MIRKVLIACGGAVAVRLVWQFKRLNVRTVAVYTEEDVRSGHVQHADEAICIGKSLKSYVSDWHRIISAAEITEVDAIHAGDGPPSEDERFSEVCAECGIQFIRGSTA